jgi:ornithine cyclodeaminase
MNDSDVLILGSSDVASLLEGAETKILEVIRSAYATHGKGASALPHSTFLRFPDDPASRIIALPAYLGGDTNSAGVKWIASFPDNLQRGLDRASAVLILNSAATGRPKAIMEASIISAKRTAASAALAAVTLGEGNYRSAGFVGCGPINFEIARFLRSAFPQLRRLIAFDLQPDRARVFRDRCEEHLGAVDVQIAGDMNDVTDRTSLISFATNAGTPYIDTLNCRPGTLILHVSLRDLSPELILSADNVVDDIDHVCRAQTSIHLAEQRAGGRDFIRCTLAEVLAESAPASSAASDLTIFSPFGLGVLDVALADYVFRRATDTQKGLVVSSFLPGSWPHSASPRSRQPEYFENVPEERWIAQ